MRTPARYSDADIYAASVLHGRAEAARVLGVSPSWIGKRSRIHALANLLPVPIHVESLEPEPRVVVADPWSHRRIADGGMRVREQARQNRTWPPA